MERSLNKHLLSIIKQAEKKFLYFWKRGSVGSVKIKEDQYVGSWSIGIKAEQIIQDLLVKKLSMWYPEAKFICEEESNFNRDRILNKNNFEKFLWDPSQLIFFIDPIDGTSSFVNKLPFCSVGIGVWRGGPIGGAITAPLLNTRALGIEPGEFKYWGSESKKSISLTPKIPEKQEKELICFVGQDFWRYPDMLEFAHKLAPAVRAVNSIPSCCLAMLLMAAGKIDLLVLPRQCPWDFLAGYSLVKARGLSIQFFRHPKEGKISLTDLSPQYLDPTERELGLIAGIPRYVEKWSEELLKMLG